MNHPCCFWIVKCFASLMMLSGAVTADQGQAKQDSPAKQINAANELLRQGETAEALRSYEAIAVANAVRDELHYNQAVAHYRNGELDAAANLFAQAAPSRNRQIAASSKYNLGNCSYQRALQSAEQQPKVAIAELQQAIAHYRGALRVTRDNADARINIELAMKLIERLEQEQEPTEEQSPPDQQQPQDEAQQSEAERENDPADPAESSQDQKQAQDNQDSSESEPSEKNEGKEGEQDKEAEDGSGQDKSAQDNSGQDKPGESKPGEENAGDENPGENQQDSEQQDSKQQDSKQQDSEPAAAEEETADPGATPSSGELTAADPAARAGAAETTSDENESGRQAMSREEALKLLQAVRDRDMLRRLQRQQLERSRRVPVERDW